MADSYIFRMHYRLRTDPDITDKPIHIRCTTEPHKPPRTLYNSVKRLQTHHNAPPSKADLELSPIMMNVCSFKKAPCFGRLLVIIPTTDLM